MPISLHVMIVEDNPADAELMILHLTEAGFQPEWQRVETETAYTAAIQSSLEMILCDWNLPHLNGLRALELLTQSGLEIPFIIVSGGIGEEVAIDLLHKGADDYVLKDHLARLGPSVRRALADRQLREQRQQTEKNLRESEDRFLRLTGIANDLIYRYEITPRRGFSYVSPSATAITGFTPEEHYADPDLGFKLVHPDDRPILEAVSRGEHPAGQPLVLRWIRKDGTIIWTEQRNVPVLDPNGSLVALEGVARDITERKRLEATLESRLIALTRPLDQPESIDFKDLFDPQVIQHLQDDFATATGVASIITYPDGTPITRPSNFCRVCSKIIRKTETGQLNCFKSDAEIGRFHPAGPIIQPCISGGLWDAGAGISVGGQHIANWLIGQVRDETQTEEKMREYARNIGADEIAVVKAFHEVPAMTLEQFQRVAQALFTMASQLSTMAYQNVQQARFITEREQAEKALRASEQNFREIFNSTAEAIFIHDTETGKIVDVNDTMLKLYGYDRKEDVLAGSIGDISANEPPYTEDRAKELIRKAAQNDLQVFEWLGKQRDGSTFWAEVSLKHSQIGGKGRILAVVRDFSERKLMEEALRRSEERWQFALEGADDGVWDWNPQTNEVFFSRQWKTMLGYDEQDIGNTLEEWKKRIHPADREQIFADLKRHFDGVTPIYRNEHRLLCKDGSYKWILDRGKVFLWTNENKPLRVIGIQTDITERKLAESQLNEQVEELKRWHNITLGREDRMMELKREINRLLIEAGKPPRYASVADGANE